MSERKDTQMQKADAYSGMVQDLGESQGTRPAPGNWVKYEDYIKLWNAYEWMKLDRDAHRLVATRAMDRADRQVRCTCGVNPWRPLHSQSAKPGDA